MYCDTKGFIDHQWSYSCIALVKLSYKTTEAMETWEKKKNTSPSHGVLSQDTKAPKRESKQAQNIIAPSLPF